MSDARGADEVVEITDPRAIRALAHPARMAVLDRLYEGAVLTATQCAHIAGITPSAMSYHLRALERWGLITRADAGDDGRERPWRAEGTSLRISNPSHVGAIAAQNVLVLQLVDRLRSEVLAAMERRAARPDEPREALAFTYSGLTLTDDEVRALNDTVDALMARRPDRDHPPGARRYHLWWAALPLTEDD